ncbi:Uncharacterized conserved protein YutE, UPF0331/DUF86 family [Cohnella sp. OV330]|uniref:DUF86 domain-containing protein n=1 Tax=Cohnella sp. OV330 TaxID=1855288 RepID=UPI0008DF3FEB|nr:HepT-like ribonuclease domain-containing protein [Cohnella sp. OV330]SFB33450.1 Uncharacterized conserved protein YutE, UPF0331/DUF86 family [Cohnella sp. OV330]
MYYVNREAIASRLRCVPDLGDASSGLAASWQGDLLQGLAQERCLHLALEIVTDVGSFLIDGFMMRDAGSYEDIVGVIGGEGVIGERLTERLRALVSLRRPLVQDYDLWQRQQLHPLTGELKALLDSFSESVKQYLRSELDPWEQPR